jgi:hypothetical protein
LSVNNNHLEQHDSPIDIQEIIPIKEERFSIPILHSGGCKDTKKDELQKPRR